MAVGSTEYTIQNLNEKTNEEIEGFLKKSKEELFNLRFQHATRPASRQSSVTSPGCTLFCVNASSASARLRRQPKRKLRRSNGARA